MISVRIVNFVFSFLFLNGFYIYLLPSSETFKSILTVYTVESVPVLVPIQAVDILTTASHCPHLCSVCMFFYIYEFIQVIVFFVLFSLAFLT